MSPNLIRTSNRFHNASNRVQHVRVYMRQKLWVFLSNAHTGEICGVSSAGQSICLTSRGSLVRIQYSAPNAFPSGTQLRRCSTTASTVDCHSTDVGSIPITCSMWPQLNWQSARLWLWWLWIQVPSVTPQTYTAILTPDLKSGSCKRLCLVNLICAGSSMVAAPPF